MSPNLCSPHFRKYLEKLLGFCTKIKSALCNSSWGSKFLWLHFIHQNHLVSPEPLYIPFIVNKCLSRRRLPRGFWSCKWSGPRRNTCTSWHWQTTACRVATSFSPVIFVFKTCHELFWVCSNVELSSAFLFLIFFFIDFWTGVGTGTFCFFLHCMAIVKHVLSCLIPWSWSYPPHRPFSLSDCSPIWTPAVLTHPSRFSIQALLMSFDFLTLLSRGVPVSITHPVNSRDRMG